MNTWGSALRFTAGLFFGLLVLLDIGRRLGVRRLANDPEGARAGSNPLEGAAFGLLALLVVFPFSDAAARQRGGLGLSSINERVRLVQGRVQIVTAPRRGTALRVWVPRPARAGPRREAAHAPR
jgi:hypothetical protein